MSVASTSADNDSAGHRRQMWIAFACWLALLLLIVVCEAFRWLDVDQRQQSLAEWLCGIPARWLPFLPWVIAGCWFTWPSRGDERRSSLKRTTSAAAWDASIDVWTSRDRFLAWRASLIVLLTATIATIAVARFGSFGSQGLHFGDLPPDYHDEYSYRLQSETFLAGRTSFPSFEPHPELFDQMHVLNEGRMASRYFPGVGVWLLPGTAIGNPWLMQHVAHVLAAWLLFWIGCELSSIRVGLLAGLLLALSPGVLLFSNLLLSHHATLVGLMVFLWAFLRMLRLSRSGSRETSEESPDGILTNSATSLWALLAGSGLTFAMLCRPMTAAGFALPMGIWVVWTHGKGLFQPAARRGSMSVIAGLGIPIIVGLGVMLWYNEQITGDWRVSPYQQYTDLYTPRHVYGFNNVLRGEQHLGPKVLDNYDRWAENLTPALAAKNVGERLLRSGDWTLGIVPIFLGVMGLLVGPRLDAKWRLVIASIITLHLVHIPYWFVGIMGWHYVFETALLWLLMASEGFRRWSQFGMSNGTRGLRWCTSGVLLTALSINLLTIPSLWPSQLAVGTYEVAFARVPYHEFEQDVEELRDGEPAVVLIIPDPADRSMDYVTNHAGLNDEVLRVRWVSDELSLNEIQELFPKRIVIIFNAVTEEYRLRE